MWADIKKLKLQSPLGAQKYLMKHGALVTPSFEEVSIENAAVKAFLTSK